MLEWLGKQISIGSKKYGEAKGSGSEHYLTQLGQQTLENIEDQRPNSLLISIDYSKAFNSLDFGHCLKALMAKGDCSKLIPIIASFLSDRTMRVKIGSSLLEPRLVMGSVSQARC